MCETSDHYSIERSDDVHLKQEATIGLLLLLLRCISNKTNKHGTYCRGAQNLCWVVVREKGYGGVELMLALENSHAAEYNL